MAFGLQTDATLIKPLDGAIVRRYTAGEAITIGQPVALLAAAKVGLADGNSSDPVGDQVLGIALQTVVLNDKVDVVIFGPVSNIKEGTAGGYVFISDTAGTMDLTSTSNGVIGICETATVLLVRPHRP